MAYSAAHFTSNAAQYIVTQDQNYDENNGSYQWTARLEIPRATFIAGTWMADNIPGYGVASPAELTGGTVYGTIVQRRILYRDVPGMVVVILVGGTKTPTYFDSLVSVDVQTVTVQESPATGSTGSQITGPVSGSTETQKYDVANQNYKQNVTYSRITITAIVNASQLGTIVSALGDFGDRNSDNFTFNGFQYEAETVEYVGLGSQSIAASQSPIGAAATRLTIVLMAGPKVLPLTISRYTWTKKVVRLDVVKADGTKIGESNSVQWVMGSSASPVTVRGEFAFSTFISAIAALS